MERELERRREQEGGEERADGVGVGGPKLANTDGEKSVFISKTENTLC